MPFHLSDEGLADVLSHCEGFAEEYFAGPLSDPGQSCLVFGLWIDCLAEYEGHEHLFRDETT